MVISINISEKQHRRIAKILGFEKILTTQRLYNIRVK